MDITNRYRVTDFGSTAECAITLDSAVFQSVNGQFGSGPDRFRLDRSGDVVSLIMELFPGALGTESISTGTPVRNNATGGAASQSNVEIIVELDAYGDWFYVKFEAPKAGVMQSPGGEDEKARRIIRIAGNRVLVNDMVEDGSIPVAVENLLRRSAARGSGTVEANLDLMFEDLSNGRRKYVMPLGRRVDQEMFILGSGGRISKPGDILLVANNLFPRGTCNGLVTLGACTESGQMAMVRVHPYLGGIADSAEIWFVVPRSVVQEIESGKGRDEITVIGDKRALPPESEFRRIHGLLKGPAQAKQSEVVLESITLANRDVFQPVLRLQNAAGKSMDCLHSQGDVAVLLAGTLGNDVLRRLKLSSETVSLGRYDYNTKTSAIVPVGGDESAVVVFSTQHCSLAKGCPEAELRARHVITISGPQAAVSRITGHKDFPGICTQLKTRNVSGIADADSVNPFVSECEIRLGRRIRQPLGELVGAVTKTAEGDLSILLGTIFEGKATWQGVERRNVCLSDMLTIRAVVDEQVLVASFNVPNKSRDGTGRVFQPQPAETQITIRGDPELVAQIRDYPGLGQICAELERRDVAAIQIGMPATAATEAKGPEKSKPVERRTPEEIDQALRRMGVVRMQGRERIVHRDLGSPDPNAGSMNLAGTVSRLHVKEKEFPQRRWRPGGQTSEPGQQKTGGQPPRPPLKTRW